MTQITLGLVALDLKGKTIEKLNKKRQQLKVIYAKEFLLTKAHALHILKQDLNRSIPVYGIILEGKNALKDWLTILYTLKTASLFVFGSSNLENAKHETLWLKNKNVLTFSSSSSSSSTMSTQKKIRTKDALSESTKTNKSLLTSTSKGGVSKPPVSVLTGRTRKTSRPVTTEKSLIRPPTGQATKRPTKQLDENPLVKKSLDKKSPTLLSNRKTTRPVKAPTLAKKKVQVAATQQTSAAREPELGRQISTDVIKDDSAQKVIEEEKTAVIESIDKVSEEGPIDKMSKEEPVDKMSEEEPINKVPEEEPVIDKELANKVMDSNTITETSDLEKLSIAEPLHIVSHLSTCSSAATDEHDAEVAAATSKKVVDVPVLTLSGRSSFSPTPSLPRPETPEVNELRLKFETLSQSSRDHVKKSNMPPEFVARIKDMKPRGPVGSRVKSMVELFMDENLNKWEF